MKRKKNGVGSLIGESEGGGGLLMERIVCYFRMFVIFILLF